MPLSNCVKFSYALRSGGFRSISASKSRRLNKVALHSLQSLISTSIKPVVPFSAGTLDTTRVSTNTTIRPKILTRCNAQRYFRRTSRHRITTNNSPASPAVVSPKRVAGKVLLAKGTPENARIILPADDCLLNSFTLIVLPRNRPKLAGTRLNLFQRKTGQHLSKPCQAFL